MAKGSFLVAQAAARAMIDQRLGGDIVYICSKNAVFAGPNNVAYSAAKADQAHQVRLLAAELGEHGIRVNGVNPDGVVRGSGIFAGGWGAAAGRRVRRARGRARRVLRPAHAAQARGAPRARRQRRRRHHAPTSSATPPACSSPSTPASPPPSSADHHDRRVVRRRRHRRVRRPGDGRRRRRRRGRRSRPSTASPTASSSATATSAGTSTELYDEVLAGLGSWPASSPTSSRSASTPGASTTASSTRDGELLAEPIAYRDDRTARCIDDVHAHRRRRRAVRDQRAAVPAVQHDLPARRRAASGRAGTEPRTSCCSPTCSPTGSPASCAPSSPTRRPPACSTPAPGSGRPTCSTGSASPPTCCPRSSSRARSAARADGAARAARSHRHRRHHGRLARHRLGGRRRPGHRPTASPTSPAAPGRSSGSSSTHRSSPTPARRANFTNEGGVDGRTRFLRNVGGLWLLQECLRTWPSRRRPRRRCSPRPRRLPAGGPRIDVDDPALHPARRHARAHRRRRRRRPHLDRRPAIVRCILDSLAAAYARTSAEPARSRTRRSRSSTSSAAARRTRCSASSPPTPPGLPVIAGPVEATALGNVLVQARAARRRAGTRSRSIRAPDRRRPPGSRRYEPVDEASARHAALGPPLRADRDRPRRAAPRPRRVGRRPAPHRQAAPARRRVRLHRRRRRGRAHARRQRRPPSPRIDVPAAGAARRRARSTPSTTLLGRPLPFPLVLAPTGFTRIADPAGRAGRRPRRGARRAAVHAVDAEHPLDRGGRARSATAGCGSRSTPGATAGSSRR